MQLHVLPGGEILIEAGILEHDAEALAHLILVAAGVKPLDGKAPAAGRE